MKNAVAVADDARPAVPETPPPAAPPQAERGFITTDELQKFLPLSRRSIFEWRKRGIIPSVQIGSKVLYHWPSVEAALLRHQNGGAT